MSTTEPRKSRPTLDDVAYAAGVSRATVSKALNQRPDISPETRQRVLAACSDVGYRRTTQPPVTTIPTIAVVADSLSSTYTLEVLKGATTEAMHNNVALTLSHTSFPDGTTPPSPLPLSEEWLTHIRRAGYIGLITITSQLSRARAQFLHRVHLPHIAIDPADQPPTHTLSIGSTNWNGGYEATQHLIDLGHQRIAFIRGTQYSVPSQERLEGYLSALRNNGIPIDESLIIGDGFSYEHGVKAGALLLSQSPHTRPTAVFACNDIVAIGVYEAARHYGLHIPHDISVIGFDDTDSARWATPRLTTVHQPLSEMGARAVRTVLDLQSDEPTTHPTPIRLTTHLVLRDSTAQAARSSQE